MKQVFIKKGFSKRSLEIINLAESICNKYAKDGYDLSLRQLYYQFISQNYFENSEANYKRLGKIISDARLAGLLDWDFIKDRGRSVIENPHWASPAEIINVAAKSYRRDLWEDQGYFVMVMCEKQALEGVLWPVCRELDVSFISNKGYSSSSTMYDIAQNRLKDALGEPHVFYLGDHDPSGIDMTRDVEDRLCLLSDRRVYVHRLALNMDQIEEYNPPENPTKLTDTRANEYIKMFGESSWELDALEPTVLADLVSDAILEYRDQKIYEKNLELQTNEREKLFKIAKTVK